MSDSLIDKYSKHPTTNGIADGGDAEPENLGTFGFLRGVRDRAIMLELCKKDGHTLAIGYGWIERMEFVPEDGITLHLPSRKIFIKGSGLDTAGSDRNGTSLFKALVRHRVPWIRESDQHDSLLNKRDPILVEMIRWDE